MNVVKLLFVLLAVHEADGFAKDPNDYDVLLGVRTVLPFPGYGIEAYCIESVLCCVASHPCLCVCG